ncbi:MAG: response regulator transcription factor [bacterium]
MRVLIVEDEKRVANFTRKVLKEAGYTVDIAEDAEQGERLVSVNEYGLILLDWLLPGKSGLELCRHWRKQGVQVPVIMVTCMDNTNDVISALDNGVDDYIVKPFSFAELLARIRALLRRTSSMPLTQKMVLDDLELAPVRREVKRGGSFIFLSDREFCLLEYLLSNTGKVVTKSDIFENVWKVFADTNTNVIEVYINRLRLKLDCGSKRPLIHTIRGVGYMMKVLEA